MDDSSCHEYLVNVTVSKGNLKLVSEIIKKYPDIELKVPIDMKIIFDKFYY